MTSRIAGALRNRMSSRVFHSACARVSAAGGSGAGRELPATFKGIARIQGTFGYNIRHYMTKPNLHNNNYNNLNNKTRSCSSNYSTKTQTPNPNQKKTEISRVEDPFDAPTYHIPEKPVSFTEGASYSLVILAGLGIAGLAAYGVFKELIFEPKEYKIFGKALKRVQIDNQVSVRIGSPITGYGQESRNRAARQRIPNRVWIDEDGIEHVEVNFFIRGPHGGGKVYAEMFKDNTDRNWKFTYLIVEIMSPTKAQLMLESYVPA